MRRLPSRVPLVSLAVLAALALVVWGAWRERSASPADPRALLARLGADYSIQLVADPRFPVETTHGTIAGTAPLSAALAAYAPILDAEWRLYPPALMRRTGLRRIVLCEGLSFAGQIRAAVPDLEHQDLYLDVARGGHDEAYVRKVIHHEFFHMIDYVDDGRLYEDPDWAALLPAGVRYGRGGASAQDDPTMSPLDGALRGFLNRYSATGVEEDKAEVFAHLIVDRAALDARAATDPILAEKAARIRGLAADFCPELDESFWDRARLLDRPSQMRLETNSAE